MPLYYKPKGQPCNSALVREQVQDIVARLVNELKEEKVRNRRASRASRRSETSIRKKEKLWTLYQEEFLYRQDE
jgi:hypothetical protein